MKDFNDSPDSPIHESTKQLSVDSCYTLDANGEPTNSQLHDDIMAGVTTRRGEQFAKKQLKAHGLKAALKMLI